MVKINSNQLEGKSTVPKIYLDKLSEIMKCLVKTVCNPPDSSTVCLRNTGLQSCCCIQPFKAYRSRDAQTV